MAEYKRFIAYFYEYIEGRRGRNAGFVKAELRNGTWRFRIQLRAARWPKEALEILGFFMQDGVLRTVLLGKGYPRGDSLIQTLIFPPAELSENGNIAGLLEQLSGIWIPAGKGWYFLSNWEERQVDAGMLQASRLYDSVDNEAETSMADRSVSQEPVSKDPVSKDPVSKDPVSEDPVSEESVSEKPALEELAAKESAWREQPILEKDYDTDETRVYEVEAMECPEEPDQIRCPKEMRVEQTWNHLRSRCRMVHPFSEDSSEYLCISPKDVRWLGMQGWPIGQNSFLMQSFCRYHHILVGRNDDGRYMLGVPGMYTIQIRSYAEHFGFSEFRKAAEGGWSDDFGYWVREFFPAIWKNR